MTPSRSLRVFLLNVVAALMAFHCCHAPIFAAGQKQSTAAQATQAVVDQESGPSVPPKTVLDTADTELASAPPNGISAPTRQEIEEQLRNVQNSQQFDKSAKSELQKRYRSALDWLMAEEEARKKIAQFQAEIASAPALLAKVKSQLDVPAPEPTTGFTPQTSLQEMEQALTQAESQLATSQTDLAQRQEELKHRGERRAELTKQLDSTRQQLESLKKQLAALPGNGESAELMAACRAELSAHAATLEQQLKRYQTEIQLHDALVDVLPPQLDLVQREKNHKEKKLAAIRTAVATKRKEESARQARQSRREIDDFLPALRDLAKGNVTLADKHKALTESLTKITEEVSVTEKMLSELEADFAKTKEKVRYAGNSASIASVLRSKRETSRDTSKYEQRIHWVTELVPNENWERLGYQEERSNLSDLDAAVREAISKLHLPADDSNEQAYQEETHELLGKKRDLLDSLLKGYDQYLSKLNDLEIVNNKMIAKKEEVANYIDERVLWVRSTEMLGFNTIQKAIQEIMHFGKPGPWLELSKKCGWGAIRKPGVIFLMLSTLGVLFAVQRRLRTRLRNLCTAASGSAKLKIWPTLEGLLLTVAMAAPLPLLFLLSSWWMLHTDGTGDLGQSLGWGLRYTAILLWILTFTRRLCASGLLAESHFDWSPYALGIARQHLRWFTYLGMPVIFVAIVADYYHNGASANSVGRLAFIGTMFLLAAFMHAILFSKNNVLRELMLRESEAWLTRFRPVLYLLAIGLPLCFALMAGIGYYYSAQQLFMRLEATLVLVLGFVLLHAVVSRWFLVKRRNLAIAQMKERQAREPENTPDVPTVIPVAETEQDWSQVHQRLQYLLYNAVAVGLLVGGWMIWADVLPALNILDKQEFWSSTVEVIQTHKDAEGNLVQEKVLTEVPTTARHALQAVLVLIATFVIGRHLPALLEITILNQMRFDRGGRHAISVLLRYLVAMIGIFIACRTMSITWKSLQWLAAGMTVGLGFGMQEIFANFISGLILLFERPIRVGDIITLDDTTGTVTNIRIRATTVTNWDRKELIVPNKELITGRLLNWTLSDAVNRIVVNVGVAYKTDTRKVRKLILDIAAEHPNVLKDPPSKATFEAFGDSTLDFVLRCYIANMETRLDTVHELHEAINDRFNQEGIEIAFPQRDLHVRSVEQAMMLSSQRKQSKGKIA